MMPTILMLASAVIVFGLGALHLTYTFFGSKLTPRDSALRSRMNEISPVISKETTMWRCWVGFNASHSIAALLFGLIYGFLAAAHTDFLFTSPFLLGVGLITVSAFFSLSISYWFRTPSICIGVSLGCYVASVATYLA